MATPAPYTFQRVYVWEIPVRVFHWVNALCLVLLGATGYLIGSPATLGHADEAYQQYWFGTVRLVHFAAGFIFLFNLLARVYWSFAGNRYARWYYFFPHRREDVRELVETLRVDILQTKPGEIFSIGHNPLAGLMYFASFLVSLFQIATGFALYAAMSSSWIPKLFTWVIPLFGSDASVRVWHHALLWFFVVFAAVHVYLVVYHDFVEGRGIASSIFGGWKFARVDHLHRTKR